MNYYKARMYSPTLCRFMQPDPIGYGDGMNLYAYVGGDPVNFVDPSGLSRVCEDGLPPLPDGSCGIIVRGAGFSCANGGTGSRTNGNFTCIVDIRFDLSELAEEIVVTGARRVRGYICPLSPIQITLGADAYLGVGASASLGGSIDLTTGQLRFVTDAALGAGGGGGVGVNVQSGQTNSGATFASQISAGYVVSGTVAAAVEKFGRLPNSVRDYSFSGGSAGWGARAGAWGNNSVTYTSPATPALYDICDSGN